MVLVLGTVASLPTYVYAQKDYEPRHTYFNGGLDGFVEKHFHQMDTSKGALEDELKKYFDNPSEVSGSNPIGDIREWLSVKAKEHRDNEVLFKTRADGLAETPLGDISQQCYDDIVTFFADLDESKLYAVKSKLRYLHV